MAGRLLLLLLSITLSGCLSFDRGRTPPIWTPNAANPASVPDLALAASILKNYSEQDLSFTQKFVLHLFRKRIDDCQAGNYDDYGTDTFSCIAISSLLVADTSENQGGDSYRTLDIYRRGFLAIADKKKQATRPVDAVDVFVTIQNLCGAIAMAIDLAEKEQVYSLLKTVDTTFSNEEQYKLNKYCLIFATAFYIGNHEELLQRTIRASHQLKTRSEGFSLSSVNPFNYLDDWSDQLVLDALEAWALFQTGKEDRLRKMLQEKEAFLNGYFASFLIWGSKTTGIHGDMRSMLQALVGYGYGLLGEHKVAKKLMEDALTSGITCEGDHKHMHWGPRAVFVDAVALPYEDYGSASRQLQEAEHCLKRERTIPALLRFPPYAEIFSGYPALLAGKMSFQREDFSAALAQISHAWSLMGARTPRQFQIDTIYYWGQACLKARRECEVDRLAGAIDSTARRISLFDGYELWKFWISKAYLAQLKGEFRKALAFLDTAVKYAQSLNGPGWIQQYTFMEDKWRPYIERIKVANLLYARGQLSGDSVLRIRSEYKARVASVNAPLSQSPQVISLAAFQNLLPDNSAAIDIFYDDEKLSVLEIRNDGVALHETDIPQKRLETTIEDINSHIPTEAGINAIAPDSTFIWNMLGLTSFGKTKDAILFVSPHRRFHYLPWNAVSLAANGGNRNIQTTVLPLGLGVQIGSRKPDIPRKDAIVLGDIGKIGEFAFLDSSHLKVPRAILRGGDSTRENVKSMLADSSLMIFFAHGYFQRQPEDLDAIGTFGIKLGNGETFSLKDVSQMAEIHTRTVFLANCKAGVMPNPSDLPPEALDRRFPEATDVLSFYHLLLSRGVHTVIMGMNNLKVTTDELVNHFLQFVDTGEAGDSAIFRAQKLMMQSGRPLQQWAGLVAVKNGI